MTSAAGHLENLIRIPSVSSISNRPVVEYAARALKQAGWSSRELPYRDGAGVDKVNLVAAPPGQSLDRAAADLAFLCHTDTVPCAANWARALDPFVAGGAMYGCGACDVKGFLACLLTAAAATGTSPPQGEVRFVLTADEEVGCVGASHLLRANIFRPRQVVVGEPTSLQPARAGKGYCLAEIVIQGREAHSAHPQEGLSAIYGAGQFLRAMEALGEALMPQQNEFFTPGFTTLNVGVIQGGTAKNIVPGECRLLVEWRPLPGSAADDVLVHIHRAAMDLQQRGLRCSVDLRRRQPGFHTAADAALVRRMERLTATPATSIPFGSEASLLAAVAQEVVVFGPGDMRTAHSDRECVPLNQLEAAVACLRSMLTSQ